jgi:rhodanese-related sulfurtransferase
VLDVRPARQFAGGHVSGALNVPVNGSSFGTRAGFVLDPEAPVALHASSAEEAELAARRLHAVGILGLAGYLVDAATPDRLEPVGIEELERLLADDAVEVIDVREKEERDEAYIPGSRHIPYRLVRAYRDELGNGRPVVTVCESGTRAGIAASVLAAEGIDARPLLGAGVHDWEARGNPVTSFRRCGGS